MRHHTQWPGRGCPRQQPGYDTALTYRALATGLSALLLEACQHNTQAVPVVLSDGSEEPLSVLKMHLADAMGVARIEFGAGDPTALSSISNQRAGKTARWFEIEALQIALD